jgi:hypothetical protein
VQHTGTQAAHVLANRGTGRRGTQNASIVALLQGASAARGPRGLQQQKAAAVSRAPGIREAGASPSGCALAHQESLLGLQLPANRSAAVERQDELNDLLATHGSSCQPSLQQRVRNKPGKPQQLLRLRPLARTSHADVHLHATMCCLSSLLCT